jgi:hypothetical protein
MNSTIIGRVAAIIQIAPAVLFLIVATASPALANDQVLTQSCSLLMSIKDWLFQIVYVLGAIGLVIIAVSAFVGRFKFAHLISLGGGLFIVAVADMLITFISSGTGDANCV